MMKTIKRCAVYTRKSTEEGLDMEFNSIDAQREAGYNYILSQQHEGWQTINDHYDDPAYSGGNMERPGLQRLLKDIEKGLIDCVVVYKIDRLTRSLADFAKIVEIFDANETTFVSVTQSFNTNTSMGKLTLNILFSFAQFEREQCAERIRDKIAASRKKGMWTGGSAPLGYNIEDKKLVINPDEAEQVQTVFKRFVEIGSATELIKELREKDFRTKKRVLRDGSYKGFRLFDKSALYKILNNKTYIGKMVHKDNVYEGQHEAIIDQKLWDQVHEILKSNYRIKAEQAKMNTPALLKGLISTKDGRNLYPAFTRKRGKQYRY